MKVGYIRVSRIEQREDLQMDALKEAGCQHFFTDKMTGAKRDREGLEKALAYLRPGDTLVVWKLDRLGRSLKDLIEITNLLADRGVEFISLTEVIDTSSPAGRLLFHIMGALAEFERRLIQERTQAGLEAARARGRKGGRPKMVKNDKATLARQLYADKSRNSQDIYKGMGIPKSTFYRYVKQGEIAQQ